MKSLSVASLSLVFLLLIPIPSFSFLEVALLRRPPPVVESKVRRDAYPPRALEEGEVQLVAETLALHLDFLGSIERPSSKRRRDELEVELVVGAADAGGTRWERPGKPPGGGGRDRREKKEGGSFPPRSADPLTAAALGATKGGEGRAGAAAAAGAAEA